MSSGAEGDGLAGGVGAVELGDDGGEVGAGAGEDGDAPRVVRPSGAACASFDDAADGGLLRRAWRLRSVGFERRGASSGRRGWWCSRGCRRPGAIRG